MGVYAGHDVVQRVKQMQARAWAVLGTIGLGAVADAARACAWFADASRACAWAQPHIKVVMMDRGVEHGLSEIASALGLPPVADVAPNSADWPFVD